MGETGVWLDMIGNATFSAIGAKEIPLKLTGNEQKRISVCLTAKPDWTKMKAFLIFQGTKRVPAALNENLRRRPGSTWKQLQK